VDKLFHFLPLKHFQFILTIGLVAFLNQKLKKIIHELLLFIHLLQINRIQAQNLNHQIKVIICSFIASMNSSHSICFLLKYFYS